MKCRDWLTAMLMLYALTPLAAAQSQMAASASESYIPKLGDIMNTVQTRHIKLWFAGKASNWELAAYELYQLKSGLLEAAVMYAGIPVNNVTTMVDPVQSISDAIAAKNSVRFNKAVDELVAGCNSCHQSMGRSFITIREPNDQPFSDQVFAPQGKH